MPIVRSVLPAPRAIAAAPVLAIASASLAGGVDPAFSNQAQSAGVAAPHAANGFAQFAYSAGAAVGDFNRDGWQDLFVISDGANNKPDRLYINNGDGTFTDEAATWGLTLVHKGKSVCVGDIDGDGWLDIYVTSAGPYGQGAGPGHHKLYRNNRGKSFTEIASIAGVATADSMVDSAWASAFGDYDLDGDLDLFVTGFAGIPSNTEHRLFRNNGNAAFTDVTSAIGLFQGVGAVAGLSARFVDMDGDRYPELLIGGDFKSTGDYVESVYFKNNRNGTFTEFAQTAGTGHEENGMGQTIGDFNNDGLLDWYVTSIYYPKFGWTGNKLYRQVGSHSYVEESVSAEVFAGGYGWGAVAVDFNHDGWLDIAETNGDGATGSPWWNEQSYLWMNDGVASPLHFTEQAIESGFVHFGRGRALLNVDYDNDGDQDLALAAVMEPFALFRNEIVAGGSQTAWLRVFLDTSARAGLAPDGFGAKVSVTVDEITRVRAIDGGSSYLGTSELSAHFGLGSAAGPAEIQGAWPDRTTTVVEGVALNQTLTISAAATLCRSDLDGDGLVGGPDLAILLGAWGSTKALADLNEDGSVGAGDLAVMLGAWGGCGTARR